MNLMKKAASRGKNASNKVKTGLLGIALMLGSTTASAALPQEATDAVTALVTDGSAMIAEFWPVLTAIVIGLVLFKLFKKGTSAAT